MHCDFTHYLADAACALTLSVAALSASADVVVGGSAMFPQKNIVENAVNSKDHTTLVAAVRRLRASSRRRAGRAKVRFTVFVLRKRSVPPRCLRVLSTRCLKPENKAARLTRVPGRLITSFQVITRLSISTS